tara:strand:- start:650 stop:952 length:303 start_codon:yes stop_codon:yes gene_type:complete
MTSFKKRYTIEIDQSFPFYKWIDRDKEIIVLNYRNKIEVFDSVCPHFGGRLELDNDDRDRLVCPFHGIKFDIKTCLGTNRIYKKIKKYNIISENPLIIEG